MGLKRRLAASAAAALIAAAFAFPAWTESAPETAVPATAQGALPAPAPGAIRIATWTPDLSRKGPGLLLKDIRSGKDAQIAAAVQVIVAARPDIFRKVK